MRLSVVRILATFLIEFTIAPRRRSTSLSFTEIVEDAEAACDVAQILLEVGALLLTRLIRIATESGVNQDVQQRFPGATVSYGSEASGAGGNRTIPPEEGGGINPETGQYDSSL